MSSSGEFTGLLSTSQLFADIIAHATIDNPNSTAKPAIANHIHCDVELIIRKFIGYDIRGCLK
jgi:hypothetical protein